MQLQQSKGFGKAGRKSTRRRDETARRNIVSARVTDQERRVLETITASTSRNVSDLVREAIEFWLATNPNRLCPNAARHGRGE